VNVFGLQAAVNIFFQEQANDRLTLNALGGNDVVNASRSRPTASSSPKTAAWVRTC